MLVHQRAIINNHHDNVNPTSPRWGGTTVPHLLRPQIPNRGPRDEQISANLGSSSNIRWSCTYRWDIDAALPRIISDDARMAYPPAINPYGFVWK